MEEVGNNAEAWNLVTRDGDDDRDSDREEDDRKDKDEVGDETSGDKFETRLEGGKVCVKTVAMVKKTIWDHETR